MIRKPVTVRHASLKEGDTEAVRAFEDRLAEGYKKWATKNEITLGGSSRGLRRTLLRRLQQKAESLITDDAVAKIHGSAKIAERRAAIDHICEQLAERLKFELIWMSGVPFRGRSRQFSRRDRRISEMRRKGLSYSEIGGKLGMTRNAVQAANRREAQRCQSVYTKYPIFKQLHAIFGIHLEVEPQNS